MKPYLPGQPADPATFAGRAEMISAVREILEELAITGPAALP